MENKIVQKLATLINQSNLSISDIARKSELSRQSIYKIINKQVTSVTSDTINAICKTLDISPEALYSDSQKKPGIVKIPVYGYIPAGIPTEMIDTSFIEDYEEISEDLCKGGKEYFGLKVKGNSMFPEFRDGDTIIFRKQDDCENNDYCAVSINHTESTFKKVIKKESGITLLPLNPEFEPMFFTNQEIEELPITILGVIKEVRRSY